MRDSADGIEAVIEELSVRFMDSSNATVERELNYFVNNAHRIEYAQAAEQNQPIGSGVQEAACKTLVAQRMKCSGMSWLQPGGQAILTLRGLAQSGRSTHAWNALRPALVRHFAVDTNTRRQLPARRAA